MVHNVQETFEPRLKRVNLNTCINFMLGVLLHHTHGKQKNRIKGDLSLAHNTTQCVDTADASIEHKCIPVYTGMFYPLYI